MNWLLRKIKFLGYVTVFSISLLVLVGVVAVAAILTLPDVGILEKCFTTSMFKVKLCPGSESYVKIKDISPYVVHAVIAAEDGSFYNHKGFDWHEMKESMTANLTSGGFRRGGSTLTQQLAKNVFLDQEKSIWRKVKEAYLANAIENRFDKNLILEKYLNVVEFGPGLYGIKPASLHYFKKSPSALHPLEAAWLASLLPNPKKYSQSYRAGQLTPFSKKMVKIILNRMQSFGKLSAPAYQTAVASIDGFPWGGLSIGSFGGSTTYSLDTDVPVSNVQSNDNVLDEEAIERMVEEDTSLDDGQASHSRSRGPKPTYSKAPASEDMTDSSPIEDSGDAAAPTIDDQPIEDFQ
ncbi:MAG: transglycosylase domain-containing protein [Bdellovibrionales bacterium]|nr:transglycosylase domain-containing protein [Bdellovibrionales bacterium]